MDASRRLDHILQRLPAPWRSENVLIAVAAVLAVLFLVAFCFVVSSVVRSAERQHEAADQVSHGAGGAVQVVSVIRPGS